ncbi:MAG: hypothetical protein EON91_05835 [Brevundimonas sp.]|uniref:hypothetical protein n=1 Tax=Brevundimonas sp. TaxID=1871086 RepID=UPI0012164460|nr:hypothetical protein [Brevundimonas sp.]RZJ18304.1 MAG: hypothetical protein EON91_05835 [Brevundimonas sp.]
MKPSFAVIAVLASLAVAPRADAQATGLTGGWVHTGTQQELVIRSSIQFRSYSMPGDFNMGGTFGAGSPSNTVISTTPTPTRVTREMALIVREDGRFSWITEKSYPESATCDVRVRQEKLGQVTMSGSSATFNITKGSERAGRSCNDEVSESDRSNQTETYRVTRSGSTLRISDGTVTWTFTRHQE